MRGPPTSMPIANPEVMANGFVTANPADQTFENFTMSMVRLISGPEPSGQYSLSISFSLHSPSFSLTNSVNSICMRLSKRAPWSSVSSLFSSLHAFKLWVKEKKYCLIKTFTTLSARNLLLLASSTFCCMNLSWTCLRPPITSSSCSRCHRSLILRWRSSAKTISSDFGATGAVGEGPLLLIARCERPTALVELAARSRRHCNRPSSRGACFFAKHCVRAHVTENSRPLMTSFTMSSSGFLKLGGFDFPSSMSSSDQRRSSSPSRLLQSMGLSCASLESQLYSGT
mmetsp:Transcript_13882/g.29057  ORF Transcript_13882/g.29057 Transcript_13882/m.29057 type:complete len:285 (+) Transcript_13882:572-1426(+)